MTLDEWREKVNTALYWDRERMYQEGRQVSVFFKEGKMTLDEWHKKVDETLYWNRELGYDMVMAILKDWEEDKKKEKSDGG